MKTMKIKKSFLLLLSFVLIFTMMPMSAFADTDGESQKTIPIRVFADNAEYPVMETEIKGAYTYFSSGYTSGIRKGVYKVIVPQDAAMLTFFLPDEIKSATNADFGGGRLPKQRRTKSI